MKKNPCTECQHSQQKGIRIIDLPACKERKSNPEPKIQTRPEHHCNAYGINLFNLKPIYCNKFSLLTKIKQDDRQN